ncbi:MAG: ATP-binding protein [Fimbriimonadales bacterium]|nr:ATP-binding protein [Fimbriimonadales bacterium]MDW8051105.1 ATP-binding protein [Armatimonadota bacterium]
MLLERWAIERVREALRVMPAVFLQGARQVGKTTLAHQLLAEGLMDAYYTLDDLTTLQSALQDPKGFVEALPERAILDEVQRVPQLLLPLKQRIDSARKAGMFLLTGSASPAALPQVADALVGRMGIVMLHPFSQGELERRRECWLVCAFEGAFAMRTDLDTSDLWGRVLRGGYPQAVAQPTLLQCQMWLRAYAETLLTRDVRLLADIERVADMGRLLRLLAAQNGQLLNLSNLSREIGIPHSTLQRYLRLLETLLVVIRIPPWYASISQQLLKTPKVFLNDTGLALAVLGAGEERLLQDALLRGRMLEAFVANELVKQISYAETTYRLYYLRTSKGREVDLIVENAQGQVIGIEIKAAATVNAEDFRHLRALAQAVGERWAGGYVLYTGTAQVPFGNRLWALPVPSLWEA